MAIFSEATDVALTPIEQARAALETIDIQPHIERRDALMASIAAKEAAVDEAQRRLQTLYDRIREERKPTGDAVAHALLTGAELPKPSDELVRDKDALVAGIGSLNRQINEGHNASRTVWDDLKAEVREALDPLRQELSGRLQRAVDELGSVFGDLTGIMRAADGPGDVQRQGMIAEMLLIAREYSAWVDVSMAPEVSPAVRSLNAAPALQAMRRQIPAAVPPPAAMIDRWRA